VERKQQCVRIEAGFDFDAGIDEAGLLLIAPGRAWRSPTTVQQRRLGSAQF